MARKKHHKPKGKTKSSPVKKTSYRKWGLLVSTFAMLLYFNTLGHQWALDDTSVIKKNYVTQQGIEGIPTIFSTSYRYGYWNSAGTLYRPISLAMFAVESGRLQEILLGWAT